MASSHRPLQHIFRTSITSDPNNIHRVEKFLMKINQALGMNEEQLHSLLIVVTEAVNNSITHGNKRNASKKVYISCSKAGNILTVKVRDQGTGFDPSEVPNPLNTENLLRESGRGVFLMHQLMDSVAYNKKGTEVIMTMNLRK
jgi:anti-sigma regulatory factor (Ser/Thr protein kinase)